MTTKHDVLMSSAWVNVNKSVGVTAGVPVSIQNKTGEGILTWVGPVTPSSSELRSGILIPGNDFVIRTLPLFNSEFLWTRLEADGKMAKDLFIGVYVDPPQTCK